jgi:ABC-type branched-subunit amino acid transport system ATPase component
MSRSCASTSTSWNKRLAATEALPVYQPLEAAVRFEEVTVEYDGISILDRVSATVPKGSCTAIIGPNGAGKTTLLLALLGKSAIKAAFTRAQTVSASAMCRSGSALTGACR